MLSPSLQICLRRPLAAVCGTERRRRHSCGTDLLSDWRGGTNAFAGRRRCTVASGPAAAAPTPPPPARWHADAAAGCTYRAKAPTRLRGGCAVRWRAALWPPPDTAGRSPRPAVRGGGADAAAGRTIRRGGAAPTLPPLLACWL